jgi:type III pantothenate kinase
MLLELDAGNTRVKWRLARERGPAAINALQGAFVMAENSKAWDEKFFDALSQLPIQTLSRVIISNVRGEEFKRNITGFAKKNWDLVPEFAASTRYCAGVTSGYDEPEKLGVDRWLAIVAAYNVAKTDCCVLNCGTTVTFDIVSEAGNHEGGYILPGLQLMKDSLLAKSPVLISHSVFEPSLSPGRNTSAAILNGALMAIVGFATGMKLREDLIKSHCVWVISGGGGELIQAHLNWDTLLSPSLVLDGLCLAVP